MATLSACQHEVSILALYDVGVDVTLLVVMGEQRSGTTLLQQVLDHQNNLQVKTGLGRLLVRAWELRLQPDAILDARQRRVLLHSVSGQIGKNGTQLSEVLAHDEWSTFHEFYCRAIEGLCGSKGPIVGHKAHGPVGIIPSLLAIRDVCLIYMVRDVRDVILSRWVRGDQAVDGYIRNWRAGVKMAHRISDHPRAAVIRFEDLVHEPTETLAAIGRLLNSPLTINTADLVEPITFDSSFGDISRTFDSTAIGRWRNWAQSGPVRYAAWVCRKELRSFGYQGNEVCRLGLNEKGRFLRRAATREALWGAARLRDGVLRTLLPPFER